MKDSDKSGPAREPRLNKRISVVLVCFFIALIFWLLLALSHEYIASLTFPLSYGNIPDQKVVLNDLPSSVTLQVKTTGFDILSFDFQKHKRPIEVDVASVLETGIELNREVLAIPTKNFSKDFHRELGSQVNITGYLPDSIVFYLSDRISKKLPVHVDMDLQFEKQYDANGQTLSKPDSITVSGPPSVIHQLEYVRTDKIRLTDVRSNVRLRVNLQRDKLLKYSDESVVVFVPVDKFTEGVVEAPVHYINVAPGFVLRTFPDKVSIRYQVALSKYNQVLASGFDAVVDAGILDSERPEKLPVEIITSPSFVRSLIVEPGKVDYILRKR